MRALLPDGSEPASLPWLPEGRAATEVTPLATLELVRQLASAVARRLTADTSPQGWLAECDVATVGESACVDALAAPFLERVYRRPLTEEDRANLADDFAMGKKLGGDFRSGMRAVVEVALQSPEFLYLLALGSEPTVGDAVELTSFETAARLSYFLTAGPPDAELMTAAKRGRFDEESLAAQAQRLLSGAAAREAISRFYTQRLASDVLVPLPELGLTADLAKDAVESSRRFVEDVVFDGSGTLRGLLTEPQVWTNAALADYYGYPGSGADWWKVELDAAQRAGFFTQPAFLTSSARGQRVSAVVRGTRIMRQVLCYDVLPPPAGVEGAPVEPPVPNATERELLEAHSRNPACHDCHRHIDPAGLAFGHYDTVGKWRDQDSGEPVDASGELDVTDAAGPFADAVELMQKISSSNDAARCFSRLWLERAQRRSYTDTDACTEDEITRRFIEGGGKIVPLLLDVAQSDALRYRLKSELPSAEP